MRVRPVWFILQLAPGASRWVHPPGVGPFGARGRGGDGPRVLGLQSVMVAVDDRWVGCCCRAGGGLHALVANIGIIVMVIRRFPLESRESRLLARYQATAKVPSENSSSTELARPARRAR
ncbi:hypothetical protein BC628DRAFT_516750 [Trametes gibbosa]|nr:hypothetical protein BC628DRAFT_516750 [Trametes gibbosa]